MNYIQFLSLKEYKNVYLFLGDSFLAQKSVEHIANFLQIKSQYDITKFDDENYSSDAIIQSCEQLSFFQNKRMCVVKDLKSISETDRKKLQAYVLNSNPMTTLIFVDTQNSKVFDFLNIEKVEMKLNDYELISFVINLCESYGKKISKQASDTLIEYCTKDLNRINLELQKLVCYSNDKDEILLQDVTNLTAQSDEVIIFDLLTHLANKDTQLSLETLCKLMGTPDKNSQLFNLISVTFQRMFFCVASKNSSDLQIANALMVKPYAITKLQQQAKKFSAVKLKSILYELFEIEYFVKNGKMSLDNALIYIIEFILCN